MWDKTTLLASHFCVSMNLILKATLLLNNEAVKQPSASVNPSNQQSHNVGSTVVPIGVIVGKSNLASLRFKPERNNKNFVLPSGNTLFPLNNRQINSRFIKSCTTYRCVCWAIDWTITDPNPRVLFMLFKTCTSIVAWVITKAKSPRLAILKHPSPSANPINHWRNGLLGNGIDG